MARCRALAIALPVLATGALFLATSGVALHSPLYDPERSATPSALEILARVKAEVIPAENSLTDYGVAFNTAGYKTLLAWNERYRVRPVWAADFESLNVTLPCCGFTAPSADETKNCGCGHHKALYGLAKQLLTDGYSLTETQAEIGRWAAYMYPREALIVEMERRALTDPAINRALQEVKEKGEC